MLKLMKYEVRRQVFSKGVILGALLTLVAAFLGFYWKGEVNGVTVTLTLMSLETLLILFVAPFEFSYTFDKDMNTRQGYLLCLIPKKSTIILAAKLLVALFQSVVIYAVFFTVVPFCERLCENKFGFNPGMIGVLVKELGVDIGVSDVTEVVKSLVVLLMLWLFFAGLGMFVTAIPGKGKVASLLGFVGFVAVIFVVFYLLLKMEDLFELIKMPKMAGNIIQWIYMLGIDAALFFGTARLMDKKVSL